MNHWFLVLLLLGACSTLNKTNNLITSAAKRSKPKSSKSISEPVKINKVLITQLNSKNSVIIDVRSPEEFVNGHLSGALNINFLNDQFENEVEKLSSKKRYFIYCDSGNRSGKALQYFLGRKLRATVLEPYESLKGQGAPLEGIDP
ncbi:MAG: rhodanese-like domain-containing protein [Bacteriovoracaceae bacterium]|nr:rhodanese-like domain-containing protein [Bacteriovoracaceae bacterium]